MSDCTYSQQIEAYHDGELPQAARAEVERHVEACASCAGMLARLEGISQLFNDAPPIRLSQMSLARLHGNLDLLTDRALLRLARVMTGVAAAIILCGSLWLVRSRPVVTVVPSQISYVLQSEEAASSLDAVSSADLVMQELSY